jgi:hypothetical protein
LGRHDNVATITLSPGYQQFEAFCSEAGVDDDCTDPVVMPRQLVSDDEEEDEVTTNPDHHETWQTDWSPPLASTTPSPPHTPVDKATPKNTPVDFALDGPSTTTS